MSGRNECFVKEIRFYILFGSDLLEVLLIFRVKGKSLLNIK